jgi:hypothetical protein
VTGVTPAPGVTLTLAASAGLIGGHCWVERRLFEVLGAAVVSVPQAPAKLALDRHAQHAAWRAGQWWDRLPLLASVDRDALVVGPAGWSGLAPAEPGAPATPADPAARLAVAYRVWLPRLAVRYRDHLAATGPAADGPVRRTLGQVGPDVAADWLEGEALVQAEVGAGAGVAVSLARAVAGAEAAFVAG